MIVLLDILSSSVCKVTTLKEILSTFQVEINTKNLVLSYLLHYVDEEKRRPKMFHKTESPHFSEQTRILKSLDRDH